MRFSYNGWNAVIRILQMAFGFTILFFSFNHGLVQKVHYNWFRLNQADYRVIETTIIDRKTYRLLEGREKEILEIICVEISDYEAKRIKDEGMSQGKMETLIGLVKDGLLPMEEAAKRLQKSVDEFKKLL